MALPPVLLSQVRATMLLSLRPRLISLDDRITPALSFAVQQSFDAGASPNAVAVGDFNSDGRPDLVTASSADVRATVFTNVTPVGSAAPAFATASFVVGTGATGVAVGDFNGDGRPDLAVTAAADNAVSILLNTTPTGATLSTFAAPVQFALLTNPQALAVGDFNGDGRPDLAISAAQVWVMLNATPSGATTPNFRPAEGVTGPANAGSLAVGDFNSDGRPDIAYSEFQYIRGLGQYNNFVNVRTNVTPTGANSISFSGSTNAYLEQLTSSRRTYLLGTGDVNGDGQADLTINGGQTVVQNTTTPVSATPTFGGIRTFGFAASPTNTGVAADLDGDGRIDLAVPSTGNTASMLTNTTPASSSTLTFHIEPTAGVGANPQAMASGDFNGDGRIDLVTANTGDNTVSVLTNTTSTAAVTTPAVVGQFGGLSDGVGVWRMNGSTGGWDQLISANADVLAASPNGRAVTNRGAAGVWYYDPTAGWYQINGHRATALAMDGLGNVFASFPSYGVAVYRLAGGWSAPLTGVPADLLAVNPTGELVASFSGYGVYRYTVASGWTLLTENRAATALAIAGNGDVVANFAGAGVYRHRLSAGWAQLNGYEATTFAVDPNGSVVANFAGFGLARYIPSADWWQPLSPPNGVGPVVSLATDLFGNVFASFTGSGVWEFSPLTGWRLRADSTPSLLAVGR